MSRFIKQVTGLYERLGEIFEPTPLQRNAFLSERFGAQIWLKREDLSPVRSYKIRGAYAFVMDVIEKAPNQRLFVCASAGNHAQGFAHACRHYRKKGVIFMPVTTPQQKVMKTEAFGQPNVEIRLVGDGFDEANQAALEFAKKKDGVMVPPFDDKRVIIGQASVAHEITFQLPTGTHPDQVVLPVGGGGLAAGVTQYFEAGLSGGVKMPDFIFAEPDGAASLYASLKAGKLTALEEVDNFVDGAAVARIGAENFLVLKRYNADQVLQIPTGALCATMIEMLNVEGIVLEPAGALAIEALGHLDAKRIKDKNVVVIVSGGNFDFERLPEVKERALRFSGLKKYFILQMPQRPGALKDFLFMLGPDDDISRFEYLKKSARNFGSVLIGIETSKAENFDVLAAKLEKHGMRFQDITDNELVGNLVV